MELTTITSNLRPSSSSGAPVMSLTMARIFEVSIPALDTSSLYTSTTPWLMSTPRTDLERGARCLDIKPTGTCVSGRNEDEQTVGQSLTSSARKVQDFSGVRIELAVNLLHLFSDTSVHFDDVGALVHLNGYTDGVEVVLVGLCEGGSSEVGERHSWLVSVGSMRDEWEGMMFI